MFALKGSDRQRHLAFHALATIGAGLGREFGVNGVKMFAISFSNPLQPLKERAPSNIVDRLAHRLVFYHAFDVQILNDNGIVTFVVKEFVSRLCDKVKTLTGNLVVLLCEGILRFPPAFRIRLLTRKRALQVCQLLLSSLIEPPISDLFAVRSYHKGFCADIHTTSGLSL